MSQRDLAKAVGVSVGRMNYVLGALVDKGLVKLGNFTAAKAATLDGLGVDGAGAHTLDEHLLISSLVPRMTLLRRLFETLE